MCTCFHPSVSQLSRRSLLGLLAAATTSALISCKEEPKRTTTQPLSTSQPASQPSSQPATRTAATTTTSRPASTQSAASQPSSQPATQQALGCPDLGAEVFPDKSGLPIASPKSAPCIVIPRTDWTTSKPNFAQVVPMNGIERITVHHTAWAFNTDAWNPTSSALENVRNFHVNDRHWADVAYHFAIDRAGRVWQARPLAYQGAHCQGHNPHNLGIVMLGNFETQSPSAAQLTSLIAFIPFLESLYSIPTDEIHTHGELGETSCPGKNLQSFMNRQRKKWAA